ncbi:Alpha/Beta hydrolase protein [Lophiotrema nucula]|uniref:Alpha/Beta hydrolase protein n=1 Tax=Lophiotrema nucula TaxID=690887 RepID=A0A6A5YSP4_9PLEO|nr:Alpha/Beta hydrolase protein [Lophiotrema nucula]
MSPGQQPQNSPTALTETFHYQNATHTYTLKWTSLGDPNAQPLIFIHGTPWSSRVWSPYALALSRQFHVYLFDNPGFGESPLEQPLPETDTSFAGNIVQELDSDLSRQSEVYAALFKEWQRNWEGRKPHVIAHDHAGLMSLRAYLLHGREYASLCLIDVVAIGPFGQDLFKTVAENPSYFEKLPDMAFEGILESYIRQASFKELNKETMEMLKAPWLREGGKKGFVRQLCQANSRNTDAVESRYDGTIGKDLPIKIIWGANDDWIPVETAHRLGKALGAKEVVEIEGAGHLIMYDQPAQLGVELGRWLNTISGS